MTPTAQLIIVETLFPARGLKRSSYVLVRPKGTAVEQTPEEAAMDFTLGIRRSQTHADAAAIFVLSQHDDSEPAYHSIREGVLLEAEEVMQRVPDTETATAQMWLVAVV